MKEIKIVKGENVFAVTKDGVTWVGESQVDLACNPHEVGRCVTGGKGVDMEVYEDGVMVGRYVGGYVAMAYTGDNPIVRAVMRSFNIPSMQSVVSVAVTNYLA